MKTNAFAWAEGPFFDGHSARCDGHAVTTVPSEAVIGQLAHESWVAGWHDADSGIRADGLEQQIPVMVDQ